MMLPVATVFRSTAFNMYIISRLFQFKAYHEAVSYVVTFVPLLRHTISSVISVSAFCIRHTMHCVAVFGMLKSITR
jgi:hypothetical protein